MRRGERDPDLPDGVVPLLPDPPPPRRPSRAAALAVVAALLTLGYCWAARPR